MTIQAAARLASAPTMGKACPAELARTSTAHKKSRPSDAVLIGAITRTIPGTQFRGTADKASRFRKKSKRGASHRVPSATPATNTTCKMTSGSEKYAITRADHSVSKWENPPSATKGTNLASRASMEMQRREPSLAPMGAGRLAPPSRRASARGQVLEDPCNLSGRVPHGTRDDELLGAPYRIGAQIDALLRRNLPTPGTKPPALAVGKFEENVAALRRRHSHVGMYVESRGKGDAFVPAPTLSQRDQPVETRHRQALRRE